MLKWTNPNLFSIDTKRDWSAPSRDFAQKPDWPPLTSRLPPFAPIFRHVFRQKNVNPAYILASVPNQTNLPLCYKASAFYLKHYFWYFIKRTIFFVIARQVLRKEKGRFIKLRYRESASLVLHPKVGSSLSRSILPKLHRLCRYL